MNTTEPVDNLDSLMTPPPKEEILRQRQLAFVGKVISCFTEEMQGRLSVLQEAADRLGGLLADARQCPQEDQERFATVLETIERHLTILERKRGYLDRFSQRTGQGVPSSPFDFGELIEEAVSFSTRLAGVRGVSLAQEAPETLPGLSGDVLRIQFLLLILIQDMLERVTVGTQVIVRAKSAENGVFIEVEGQGTPAPGASSPLEQGNPFRSAVEQVVEDLGARLHAEAMESEGTRTALFLPLQQVPNTPQGQPAAQ